MTLAAQMVADLDTLLNTGEFAVEATIGGGTVNVILDVPFNATDEFGRQVENADYSIVGKWSDIGAMAQGDTATINSTTYYALGAPERIADGLTGRVKLSTTAQHG